MKHGNDIIVFRFNEKEEKIAIKQILKLVKNKKVKESRINRSVVRIIKMKEKYNISDDSKVNTLDIGKINEEISKIKLQVEKQT